MAGLCINYHWNAVPTTIGDMYQLRCSTHLTAEGAGHGEAMYVLGDEYWNTVFAFLNSVQ